MNKNTKKIIEIDFNSFIKILYNGIWIIISFSVLGLLIGYIYEKNFQETLIDSVNPYGDGGAVDRIVKILKSMSFNNLVKKTFYDLNLL